MEAQVITSVASAILAATSAGVSVYYSHKSTQFTQRSAQNQYEDNMRGWAERTADVTGQLVQLLSNPDGEAEFNRNCEQLLGALRCQIDKGRWFFPNTHTDQKGTTKPFAYRGIRQPILDILVELYDQVDTIRRSGSKDRASACQTVEFEHRVFVSEVQKRLNPATRDANYRKYIGQLSAQFVEQSLHRPDRPRAVRQDDQPDSAPAADALPGAERRDAG
jgi:hypothetical protein